MIGLATSIATFLGGFFALRLKDRLHLVLGFSAGAMIAVAFFDLMPEALDLGAEYYSSTFITSAIAAGFLIYMLLDRISILRVCPERKCENPSHFIKRGRLGAGSLSIHSFLDGMAIGLAFQVSAAVGAVVTAAVLVHDFSDGINTVNLILKNRGNETQAYKWLMLDAIAPLVGVVSTLFFRLPESILGIILALFCGFFLYIGASDLLPESHHSHPAKLTLFMTVLGMLVLFVAVRLASL